MQFQRIGPLNFQASLEILHTVREAIVQKAFDPPYLLVHFVVNFSEGILIKVRKGKVLRKKK